MTEGLTNDQRAAQRKIDQWCGDLQTALEDFISEAPNAACKALVEALLDTTYYWPEYPQ